MGIPLHSLNMLDGSSRSGYDLSRLQVGLLQPVTIPPTTGSVTVPGAVTAGTAFTSLPTIGVTGGTGSGLTVVATSLTVVSATVVAGGTSGFVNADTITLSNGVVLAVASVSSGVVATVTVSTGGNFLGTNNPGLTANPVSQVATNGSGVGTTSFTLVYGLGTVQITNSGTYTVVPTGLTVTGGGGSGASVAAPTLGGAGKPTTVFVSTLTEALPANYSVFVMNVSSVATTGVPLATVSTVLNKQPNGFSLSFTPLLAASSIVAPSYADVLVIG